MTKRYGLLLFAFALLAGGCASGIRTSTDWNREVDFSGFSTYEWVDSAGSVDSLTANRIRNAVESTLEAKGFAQVSSNSDLAVSYQITTGERRSFNAVHTGWGGGYRWGSRSGWGMSTTQIGETVWAVGTIVLGVFDTESKELVWTGSASADLNPRANPEQREAQIQRAVARVLRDFPPR